MNTALNRTTVLLLTNKSGGDLTQGAVVILDSANAGAFTTTTTSGYVGTLPGVIMEPNGIANNATGLVAIFGYVPKINLSGSASLGDFVKCHTVAGQGVRHATPSVAGDFAQVLGTGTTPAAMLIALNFGGGTGNVLDTGATTANHLAVWNGASDHTIKDGGEVPSGGVAPGQVIAYPSSFTGDVINGSSTTPFVDVAAFDTKEVLNSRILHLKTLGASKNQRVRVTLGTTKAAAFDVTTCVAYTGPYWSSAWDTYLEVRLSDASDNQLAIARIGVNYNAASAGDYAKTNSVRVGGSTISGGDNALEFNAPLGTAYTLRFARDGSNVISFWIAASNLPMALGQPRLNSDNTVFTATVSGTLARIEYSIHTPSGPGAGIQFDAYVDYLASV